MSVTIKKQTSKLGILIKKEVSKLGKHGEKGMFETGIFSSGEKDINGVLITQKHTHFVGFKKNHGKKLRGFWNRLNLTT